MPAVVGAKGIETHVPITLNEEETRLLLHSAGTLQEIVAQLAL